MKNSLEWGTPVLYMRSPDGVLFDLHLKRYNDSTSTAIKTLTHNSPPIDDQVSQWLQAKASKSKETKKTYEENIRKFREVLREHDFDLNSEDVPAISAILQAWAAQGPRRGNVSNSTFNQRQSTISSFYKFALAQQWIKTNPIEMVKQREKHNVNEAMSLDHTTVKNALRKLTALHPAVNVTMRSYASFLRLVRMQQKLRTCDVVTFLEQKVV